MSDATQAGLPMAGSRIIDLSTDIAGPYATKLCFDAGADVVKVEAPGGDPMRHWTSSGHKLEPGEDGAFFQFLNGGKRSVVWDLETDEGRAHLLDLIETADVVVESMGPGRLAELGLGFDVMQERNPAVSLVSLSLFGQEGPWADRVATEWTIQAEIGGTAYRGLPSRGPVGAGGRLGEWAVASYTILGLLSAWRAARRCGVGQLVDVSTFEAMVLSMTVHHDLMSQFNEGPLAQALETPSIEPAKDGWVGLCTYTGQQWKEFCALMGRPEIGEDEKFFDGRARMDHLEFIQEAMHAWTREHTIDEIIELCSLLRIPAAPIGDGRTVLEFDHFQERGVFLDNPGGFKQPRTPFLIGGVEFRPPASAPSLGEHTAAIEESLDADRTAAQAKRAAGPAVPGTAATLARPFEGVRVVDLTAFWAGPISTGTLGALGADIVKVESIQRPDGMRFAGANPKTPSFWEHSPVYHGANLNKRAITLDLDKDEGKALLRRLLADADVVIENFSARVMHNFGFDWEVLHEINPRLVSVRMPAWGLDGPWRDRVGFAPTVEQASGMAWTTGYEDMPLILRGVCDPLGGMHTLAALTLALEERDRTGVGRLVEVPLIEPALNIASEQVIEYTAYGEFLSRTGNRGPYAAPQGVYGCRPTAGEDRYEESNLALAVATDEQWRALVEVIGRPDWALAPGLEAERGRRDQADAIDAGLSAWFAERDCAQVAEQLRAAGIPAAPLVNAHYLHPNEQLAARAFLEELDHPAAGRMRYPGLPFRLSSRPGRWHATPPPTMGQHNEEILAGELGLSAEEMASLAEKKVIGNAPDF